MSTHWDTIRCLDCRVETTIIGQTSRFLVGDVINGLVEKAPDIKRFADSVGQKLGAKTVELDAFQINIQLDFFSAHGNHNLKLFDEYGQPWKGIS